MHNEKDDTYLVVLVSYPTLEQAKNIARELIEKQLAACVQLFSPIVSIYQWNDRICEEQEVSLQIKCTAICYQKLEETIKQHHPYDVPEIIAIPITQGASSYLNWIKEKSQS